MYESMVEYSDLIDAKMEFRLFKKIDRLIVKKNHLSSKKLFLKNLKLYFLSL